VGPQNTGPGGATGDVRISLNLHAEIRRIVGGTQPSCTTTSRADQIPTGLSGDRRCQDQRGQVVLMQMWDTEQHLEDARTTTMGKRPAGTIIADAVLNRESVQGEVIAS